MRIVDIACDLISVALLLPSQEATAQFQVKKVLTLDIARKMVAAAELEAARHHLAGVVAVVDDGGWPILLERMDNAAFVASVELAQARREPRRCSRNRVRRWRTPSITVGSPKSQRATSSRCRVVSQLWSMGR